MRPLTKGSRFKEIMFMALAFFMIFSPELRLFSLNNADFRLRPDDLLIIALAIYSIGRDGLKKIIRAVRKTPLFYPIALFLLLQTVGLLRVIPDRASLYVGSLLLVKQIEFFLIYFLASNLLKDKREIRRVFTMILITALLATLFALVHARLAGPPAAAPFHDDGNIFASYLGKSFRIIKKRLL